MKKSEWILQSPENWRGYVFEKETQAKSKACELQKQGYVVELILVNKVIERTTPDVVWNI